MIKKCFHTPKKIFTIDDVDYYAADRDGVGKFNGDVIINLTPFPNIPVLFPEIKKYYSIPYEEIMIPWPDLGLPKMHISFWGDIHKIIKYKKWKVVCVHCEHGHGRTGTALSCILVATRGIPATDAIDTIRYYHCCEAVETLEQCNYIAEVDSYYNNCELVENYYQQILLKKK